MGMIASNELRIGNLFQDVDKTPCYYAGSWQRNDGWIHRDSANNTYKDMEMYPIQLTSEIFEKFGFEKDSNEAYIKEPYAIHEGNIYWSGGVYSSSDLISKIEIKYVHQLQNLYWSLTGEELKIEL